MFERKKKKEEEDDDDDDMMMMTTTTKKTMSRWNYDGQERERRVRKNAVAIVR